MHNSDHPSLPARRRPTHGVLEPSGRPVIVFLTVCAKDRERWLTDSEVHSLLVSVWRESTGWLVGRYVLMPNHIHMFVARGDMDISLETWVRYWKSIFSQRHGHPAHRWQAGHWDTRLRSGESHEEKWHYVRANPVRHGLAANPDDWPFQGEVFQLSW